MKKKVVMILCAGTMLATMPLSTWATEVGTEMMDAVMQEKVENLEEAELAEKGELVAPALTDWEYNTDTSAKTVTLIKYTGSAERIRVPATYKIDEEFYAVCLQGNLNLNFVKEVTFEKGVIYKKDSTSSLTGDNKGLFEDNVYLEKASVPEGVDDCTNMFKGCYRLKEAPEIPEGVTNCSYMFDDCASLAEAPEIPEGVENCSNMFNRCTRLTEAPEIPKGVTNCSGMFANCVVLTEAPEIPEGVENCSDMFNMCNSLTEAPKIPEGVTNCSNMFNMCYRMTTAPEIPKGVTNCGGMFCNCWSLTVAPSIPKGVKDCNYMFCFCESLTKAPDIPEGVTNCNYMFWQCSKLAGEMTIYEPLNNVLFMFSGAATIGDGLTIHYANDVNIDEILENKSENSKITAKPLQENPTPVPDTPSPDTPVPDTPSPDTPVPDTPSPDTPVLDNPSPDTPVPDNPTPASGSITSAGIYVDKQNKDGVVAGLVAESTSDVDKEYRWLCYDIKEDIWSVYSDWTSDSEWVTFNPGKGGDYLLQGEVRCVGMTEAEKTDCIGVNHHPNIKGKCQMPYEGEGGGYLIGLESYDNVDYQYEMLILDCTLLAEGKDAWTYTTGKCSVPENCFWTIWQPQYGYYWTLFRVYDKDGNLIDQDCYGFENI